MNRDRNPVMQVGAALQPIASALEKLLAEVTGGERLGFVLIVAVSTTSQYVSNCSRADGQELIRDLLARWDANRADIPATMNPDLATPLTLFDVTFKHLRERTVVTMAQVPANDPGDAKLRARAMLAVPDQWEAVSVIEPLDL